MVQKLNLKKATRIKGLGNSQDYNGLHLPGDIWWFPPFPRDSEGEPLPGFGLTGIQVPWDHGPYAVYLLSSPNKVPTVIDLKEDYGLSDVAIATGGHDLNVVLTWDYFTSISARILIDYYDENFNPTTPGPGGLGGAYSGGTHSIVGNLTVDPTTRYIYLYGEFQPFVGFGTITVTENSVSGVWKT